MANTYNKFKLKRTSVSGRTANTTDSANNAFLDVAELAVNLTDKKLFSSNGSALFEIGANLSSLSVVDVDTTRISVGNTTVNTVITGSLISGNGAGLTSVDAATVGGNTASDLRTYAANVAANAYSNAISVAASDATTKTGTAYSNAVSYANTIAGTAYSNAVSIAAGDATTKAGTAYSNAVTTAASDATTKAGTAYSNAIAYSANASNITSGTLNTARLPSDISISGLANSGSANVTNNLWVGGNTVLGGTLTISGNLTLNGNTTIVGANNLIVQDAVISLHTQANLAPWATNDGKLIGTAYHYYDTADRQALLAMNPGNTYLTYYNTSTDAALGDPSGTTLGTIQANTFVAGNTTTYSQLAPTSLVVGNTTVGSVNAVTLNVSGNAALGNTTVTGFIDSSSYGTFNGTVNATSFNAGANVKLTTTQIGIGNTTVNTVITSTGITANGATLTIGNTTINGTLTATGQTSLGGAAGAEGLRVITTTSAVNYLQATGAATAFAPVHSVAGSDANISLAIQSKGTGAIDLAAGSSGVNISNGGTVTGLTLTSAGSGYTSFPTATVSLPTTAGGVQAVASFTRMYPTVASIANGGTGYTVGDTLTLVGGTVVTSAATFTVSTVSSGVITGVSIAAASSYTVLPTSPVSVTGGTGTGATLNPTYALGALANISNAGSGYVEQPTVSFSGGGGSGAAAYATVGATPKIQSLGTNLSFYTPGGEQARVIDVPAANRYIEITGGLAGSSSPGIGTGGTEALDIYSRTNSIWFATNGKRTQNQLVVAHTASAVNYVQVTGAATTGQPTILATGSDAAVGLTFNTKGVGTTRIQSNGISIARFTGATSAINYLDLTHSITGQGPVISAQSISDTNTPLVLKSLGTGAIDLAAGSSGVNISNGGTVTAITITNAGATAYSSIPSVAVTAPTTAGGVQAVATALMRVSTGGTTLQSGGTGYTAGDVLTLVGGTFTTVAQITVSTVTAGVISTFTVSNAGAGYSVLPSNPISVTGGTGAGATFNATWFVSSITVGTAGSGYVEQPTVSFSGGGGSGAAAYASVGSGVALKTLAGTLTISGSSGDVLRIYDYGGQAGIGMRGHTLSGTAPVIFPTPSNSSQVNISFQVASLGTGAILFSTNAGLSSLGAFNQVDQLRVAHTASAVNYVQVTGAATGSAPAISVQGSDSAQGLGIFSKGGSAINFWTGGTNTTRTLAIFGNSGNVVNGFTITPALAGGSPTLAVAGTDTNIDLTLTPKGTGSVVATAPVKLQGYTVATLPTAGTIGRTAYVTDATAPTYLGTLTGGGTIKTPVFDNGTAWVSY